MAERRDDSAILGMLTGVVESITAMRQDLSDHIAKEPEALKTACKGIVDEVTAQAFPVVDGKPDLAGHKSAHQEMIDAYRTKKEFWQKLLFELSRWGLLGVVLWMLKAALEAATAYVHHAPK